MRPGDTFDPERIDLSLKTLFATGLFADVQIEQRGADLVVVGDRKPDHQPRHLRRPAHARRGRSRRRSAGAAAFGVHAARAQADVQRIIEVYRRAGRFAAQVTPQVRELDQNRVDLIFEVDEGPVTGVRDINFIGNEEFSDRTLRDAIVTTESSWWNFFASNDNYDPDRLEYDREQLRQFYNNRGYADFRVVSAVAELTPDQRDFFITFTVDEGVRYEFGEIRVQTELNRLSGSLAAAPPMPIRTGTVFRGDLIEDAIDAMTLRRRHGRLRQRRHHAERGARSRQPASSTSRFEVDEGPRVFIERIDIVGNTRTLDRVIRREMRVTEGDAFNRVLLDRSRQRIQRARLLRERRRSKTPTARSRTARSSPSRSKSSRPANSRSRPAIRRPRTSCSTPRSPSATCAAAANSCACAPRSARSASRSTCASPSRASWAASSPRASTSIRCAPTSSTSPRSKTNRPASVCALSFPIARAHQPRADLLADPGRHRDRRRLRRSRLQRADAGREPVRSGQSGAAAAVRSGRHVPHLRVRLHGQLGSPQRPDLRHTRLRSLTSARTSPASAAK